MYYQIDEQAFLEALQELDDELTEAALASGEVVSYRWYCTHCAADHTAFELVPPPAPCSCGSRLLFPRAPTFH
ncbi:MAG TPA: hypothetical protein VNO84_03820 [Burkholderiaceae bacterium]|nr:hypothetical protein [Burkholderiaceae bacterium]